MLSRSRGRVDRADSQPLTRRSRPASDGPAQKNVTEGPRDKNPAQMGTYGEFSIRKTYKPIIDSDDLGWCRNGVSRLEVTSRALASSLVTPGGDDGGDDSRPVRGTRTHDPLLANMPSQDASGRLRTRIAGRKRCLIRRRTSGYGWGWCMKWCISAPAVQTSASWRCLGRALCLGFITESPLVSTRRQRTA
jgi:hypothetical protein